MVRIIEVVRHLCRLYGPTPLLKQRCPEHIIWDHVQTALERILEGMLCHISGQPVSYNLNHYFLNSECYPFVLFLAFGILCLSFVSLRIHISVSFNSKSCSLVWRTLSSLDCGSNEDELSKILQTAVLSQWDNGVLKGNIYAIPHVKIDLKLCVQGLRIIGCKEVFLHV